jgi:hypothetical protein
MTICRTQRLRGRRRRPVVRASERGIVWHAWLDRNRRIRKSPNRQATFVPPGSVLPYRHSVPEEVRSQVHRREGFTMH